MKENIDTFIFRNDFPLVSESFCRNGESQLRAQSNKLKKKKKKAENECVHLDEGKL